MSQNTHMMDLEVVGDSESFVIKLIQNPEPLEDTFRLYLTRIIREDGSCINDSLRLDITNLYDLHSSALCLVKQAYPSVKGQELRVYVKESL